MTRESLWLSSQTPVPDAEKFQATSVINQVNKAFNVRNPVTNPLYKPKNRSHRLITEQLSNFDFSTSSAQPTVIEKTEL
jgi:hypothetical protein